MTDAEVEAAARSDPDAQPMTDAELAGCIPPARLRSLREQLGLTQAAFALRFGISLYTLRRWEANAGAPTHPTPAYIRVVGAVLDTLGD